MFIHYFFRDCTSTAVVDEYRCFACENVEVVVGIDGNSSGPHRQPLDATSSCKHLNAYLTTSPTPPPSKTNSLTSTPSTSTHHPLKPHLGNTPKHPGTPTSGNTDVDQEREETPAGHLSNKTINRKFITTPGPAARRSKLRLPLITVDLALQWSAL